MEKFARSQALVAGEIERAFINFKKLGLENMTLGQCSTRVEKVEKKWADVSMRHKNFLDSELYTANTGHEYVAENLYEEYEDNYLTVVGQFRDHEIKLKKQERQDSLATTSQANSIRESSVDPTLVQHSLTKLAPIQIPNFSGDPNEWGRFRDLFKSAVVDSSLYTDIHKFFYLQSLLTGEAAAALEGIPVEGKNFMTAWTTLKQTFDNKRRLVDNLLKTLFSLDNVTKESSAELRLLLTGTKNTLVALKALERPIESWDDLLVYITINKTDKETRKQWEMSRGNDNNPSTFDSLSKFLQVRIQTLSALENNLDIKLPCANKKETPKDTKNNSNSNSKTKAFHSSKTKATPKCNNCSLPHWIEDCADFVNKSVAARREIAKVNHLCFNCLNKHYLKDCKRKKMCTRCAFKHHTLLHVEQQSNKNDSISDGQNSSAAPVNSSDNHTPALASHCCGYDKLNRGTVLLSTVWVYVMGPRGNRVLARALLDQCSQSSFITNSLCQRLYLPRYKIATSVSTVGENQSLQCTSMTNFVIQPRFESDFKLNVSALAIPKVTGYKPYTKQNNISWDHLKDLRLADPHFLQTAKIDLLLSSEVHAQVVEGRITKDSEGKLLATETKLGWVISGVVGDPKLSASPTVLHVAIAEDLDQLLERFWEQEELKSPESSLTEEEQECENHFQTTHTRDAQGRYVVRLPFRSKNGPDLGSSAFACKSMLHKLERKFENNEKLKRAYSAFMSEYEELGHMTRVTEDFLVDKNNSYCLPHHGVIKEGSTTTKLRTVFNGSFRTSTGQSLNDILHTGANLLPDLASLVLGWRKYRYAFAADIEKMYRQIKVHPEDQHYQMVVWRSDPEQEVNLYKLNTLTYGLNCSPFIANRVRLQLAQDERDSFPLGAEILKNECYLDDVLSGASTLGVAKEKQQQAFEICKAGGFNLRKWVANDPALLEDLPPDLLAAQPNKFLDRNSCFSILGLSWHPVDDSFQFVVNTDMKAVTWTKRIVLSKIAQVYDPLGWLAPVVLTAKLFMQTLWISKIGWDTPLSKEDTKYWLKWYSQLNELQNIRIPRWCGYLGPQATYELHGFADASKKAYSAVVYLRSKKDSEVNVKLLIAKTKVNSIKPDTIPRLELRAAVLLAELVKQQCSVLNIDSLKLYLWSDSQDVLYWLQGDHARWPVFVRNRCIRIHELLPEAEWYYVPTAENPADPASRGKMPGSLYDLKLWWEGPSWLKNAEIDFDRARLSNFSTLNPDSKKFVHVTIANNVIEFDPFKIIRQIAKRFSTFEKLVPAVAYVLRLQDKINNRYEKNLINHVYACYPWYKLGKVNYEKNLSPEERERARLVLILYAQRESFSDLFKVLEREKPVPQKHPLKKLNPLLKEGLLRVGGRIQHSLLSYDQKHPLILTKDHPLTSKIVVHTHRKLLHGGVQLTLATLRLKYWIIKGRQVVKGEIHRCVPCLRYRASPAYQLLGNLPKFRVEEFSHPFEKAGVDYAGPYWIRMSPGRGSKAYKGYIAIFVSLSVRAVHIEVVSDYSSEAFMAAYRRFVSRRGHCSDLYSDQGPTFTGAAKEIKELFKKSSLFSQEIENALSKLSTMWHFNAPASPHCGGIWEAAVKSTKHHLRRVIGEATLTYEELNTLLCQIEAILNSRPLWPMSDDPMDLEALSPAHFLIQSSSFVVPEPNLTEEKIPVSKRWQLLQQMMQHFWSRWSSEYLQTLQARNKWTEVSENLKVGELVLIKNEVQSPSKWPLARVIQVHPGKDNLVRCVTVKSTSGTYQRPVQKLVKLKISEQS